MNRLAFLVTAIIFSADIHFYDRDHSCWLRPLFFDHGHFFARGHYFLIAAILVPHGHFWWPWIYLATAAIFGDQSQYFLTLAIFSARVHFWWPRSFWFYPDHFWLPRSFLATTAVLGDFGNFLSLRSCFFFFCPRPFFFLTPAILNHRGHLWWPRLFELTTTIFLVTVALLGSCGRLAQGGYIFTTTVIFTDHGNF